MIESNKKHLKIYLMVILTIMTILVSTQSLAVSKVEGLTVKMEGEKAHLEWQTLPDALRYDVYVSVSGTGYKYLGSTTGNSANIKGFTPDTVYQVMVRALLTSGTAMSYSDFSEPVSIILKSSLDLELEGGIVNNQMNVEKVTGLSAQVTGTQVALNWDKAMGADGYEISVEIPNYGSQTFNVTSLRVTLGGVSRSGDYSVKVRGYKIDQTGQKIYGEFSEIVKFSKQDELQQITTIQKPGQVTGVNVNVIFPTIATVSWNAASDATHYEIKLISTENGSTTTRIYAQTVAQGTQCSIGIKEGGSYKVTVTAYKLTNTGKIYGEASKEVSFKSEQVLQKPAQVTGLNVKVVSPTIATISWNPVPDATHYEIKLISTENGRTTTKTFAQTANQGPQCSMGIKEGGSYKVTVTAYKLTSAGKTYGEASKEVSFKSEQAVQKPAQVTGLNVKVMSPTIATISWNAVSDATHYEIKLISTENGRTTTKTFAQTANQGPQCSMGIKEGGSYKVTVTAYKLTSAGKTYGEASKEVSFKSEQAVQKPAQVTGLTRKLTGTTVTFNWNKMSNVDGYEITLVVPKNGTYTYEATQNTKSLNNIVVVNADYVATVKAYKMVNGTKLYGPASKELRFRGGVNATSKPTATLSGTNLTLRWPITKAAEGYEISLIVPGGKTYTYSTTGTSKTISNIGDLKKDYTVKVRAYRKDENGKKIYGAYSPETKFRGKVGNVTGLKSTVTGTALKLNWNSVYNAEGYELIIFVPGVGNFKYTTKTNSYSASNYVTIKGYDFTAKVRAYGKNEKGQTVYGDYSNTIKFRAK